MTYAPSLQRLSLVTLINTVVCLPMVALAWQGLVRQICPPLGVPVELAMAVIEAESGGEPYALGVTMPRQYGQGHVHRGYYPCDIETATVLLAQALTYTPNIGVGLMQITWADDPYMLLDPVANITRGCTMLGEHLAGPGSMKQRIGRYHSHTPARRDAYGQRILSLIERRRAVHAQMAVSDERAVGFVPGARD